MILAAVLALAAAGDPVVLRERAGVDGRFVRLLDLVDADRLGEPARRALAPVYLGRAPGAGGSRTIGVEEIRRELERRGIDPSAFEFRGSAVEVVPGGGESAPAQLRRAIAFEIKRHLLEAQPGLDAREISVRVSCDALDGLAADAEIAGLKPGIPAVPGAGTFAATVGGRAVSGDARVLREREVWVAARDIAPGRVLDRDDVELHPVALESDDAALPASVAVVGCPAALRLRKGETLAPASLRLKPAVRKGDVVRAVTRDFEVDARALEDGAPGAEIALEFLATKSRFRARVSGPGRVRGTEEDR